MGVEVRPLGVKCNIACHYCYQDAVRSAGGAGKRYDLEAIKASVLRTGGPFTLFGGEPLLIPKADLEHLLAWGLETFGTNSIQTNAILLDDDHVRMFRDYKVSVGVSLDGPGDANSARWAGSASRTAAATAKVETALETLLAQGLRPSVIATLHRRNAAEDALPGLLDWFRRLDRMGVRFARVHLLEADAGPVRDQLALSDDENLAAMRALESLERTELATLRFDVFGEIAALLLGRDKGVSCTWRACDPYTTEAVQGVEGFGQSSNCGRTNKAGVDFVKAAAPGFERYLALEMTEQAAGGCRGCRFFLMCKGQCPGTSLEGDWRNRTEHCRVWFGLFEDAERRLSGQGYRPLSRDENRPHLEARMRAEWMRGQNPPLAWVLDRMRDAAQVTA